MPKRIWHHFHVVLEDVASASERYTESEMERELKDAIAHHFRHQPVEIDVVEHVNTDAEGQGFRDYARRFGA